MFEWHTNDIESLHTSRKNRLSWISFSLSYSAIMQNKRFFYLLLIAAANVLQGCSIFGNISGDEEQQNFAKYAEEVFRRQNNATSEVMTLSADDLDNKAQYETLLSVERNMQNACELLNDFAARDGNGENSNVFFKARVGNAVKDCDRATQKLENLLEELDLASRDVKSDAK